METRETDIGMGVDLLTALSSGNVQSKTTICPTGGHKRCSPLLLLALSRSFQLVVLHKIQLDTLFSTICVTYHNSVGCNMYGAKLMGWPT